MESGETAKRLAIRGGRPVRSPERPWPEWPRFTDAARREVEATLASGRWAISGPWVGQPSREGRFAEGFAELLGARHCVPCANGSSAILIALEALGIGAEDEVLVPGLTWVANASAVLRANAVPVLVDVEPDTLCLSLDAARRALTPRTRAITLVHLYGSMADVERFRELADEAGVALIEDCSHVHGARFRDAYAGTFGDVGVFSMQQTKLLTSGEGGAVVTDRPDLARRLAQLRADGRAVRADAPGLGELELEEIGDVLGANFSLSEIHAALLIEGLSRLEAENRVREENARRLDAALGALPGVAPVPPHPKQTLRAFYSYAVRVDPERLGGVDLDELVRALTAELGFPAERIYRPLDDHPLYQPSGRTFSPSYGAACDPKRFDLPECERAYASCVAFHHRLLLGHESDMDDVARAFEKVWEAYGASS